APTATNLSAGAITISGGKRAVQLMAPPIGAAYASVNDSMGTLWNGGEALFVSASGGDVPPFSGTVVAPPPVRVSSPAPSTGGSATPIVRAQGLSFSWA